MSEQEAKQQNDEEDEPAAEEDTGDDTIETEGRIDPERMARFTDGDPVWLDQYLNQEGEEGGPELALETEDNFEEEADICEGPFWPSPDDPNTGYCTCCEQPYYGDLQDHPCLSTDDQDDDDDGDEDTAKRPAVKP